MKSLLTWIPKWYKKVFYIGWLILFILLVLFSFKWCRDILKGIIISFLGQEILEISYQAFQFLKPAINIIWIVLSFILIYFYIMNNYKKKLYIKNIFKENIKDDLDIALFNYINSINMTAFLLNGNWGSGKSHRINEFMEKMKKCDSYRFYRISCFGLTNRSEILKEIKNVCEAEDSSINKKIVNISRSLPVIGELIYSLCKKDYELNNIQKRSIFIFDDLERISVINEDILESSNKSDTAKELINMYIADRYNIITGLLNELIEQYNMRVIIIANIDKIPPSIFQNQFIDKLSCQKFKLENKNLSIWSLILAQVNSFNYMSDEHANKIEVILLNNLNSLNYMWLETETENFRNLNYIIFSFISTVIKYDLFDNEDLCDNILFSIFLAHQKKGDTEKFFIGENPILFFIKKELYYYGREKEFILHNIMYANDKKNKFRWCGNEIAKEWITGNHSAVSIEDISNQISSFDNSFNDAYCNDVYFAIPKTLEEVVLYLLKVGDSGISKVLELFKNDEITFSCILERYDKRENSLTNVLRLLKPLYDNSLLGNIYLGSYFSSYLKRYYDFSTVQDSLLNDNLKSVFQALR